MVIDAVFGFLLMALFFLGLIGFGVVMTRFIHQLILFERRDKNPYRRYCRKCGQCQEVYTLWIENYDHSWWEDMGPVPDENCPCHGYATYKSLI